MPTTRPPRDYVDELLVNVIESRGYTLADVEDVAQAVEANGVDSGSFEEAFLTPDMFDRMRYLLGGKSRCRSGSRSAKILVGDEEVEVSLNI